MSEIPAKLTTEVQSLTNTNFKDDTRKSFNTTNEMQSIV